MLMARQNHPVAFPQRVLEELFQEPFFAVAPMRMNGPGKGSVDAGNLPLDIAETEREVVVRATVPGFTREQISVEVSEGVLRIVAEQTEETEQGDTRYHRRERRIDTLARAVRLPVAVREDGAQAALKDGVLTLTLPKFEKPQPRKIAIN